MPTDIAIPLRNAKKNMVQAIKILAETGKFQEATKALEALRSIAGLLGDDGNLNIVDGLSFEERKLAKDGKKIHAIKEARNRTGLGLKEAKDLVEAYMGKHGYVSNYAYSD